MRWIIVLCLLMSSVAHAQFPDETTTGITNTHCPNWAVDKINTSSRTISTAGTTLYYEQISGQITVNAPNVTIKCVKIDANGSLYGINCLSTNCTNLLVEDAEIFDTASTGFILKGSAAGRATANRVNVHTSVKDAMKIRGHANLYNSYIHVNAVPGEHNDAIQIESGSNIDIVGNRIDGPLNEQTSAIIAKSDFGIINNLRVANNRLSGGTHTFYSVTGGFGPPTNVIVANNQWLLNSWKFSPVSFETNAGHCLEWYGNTNSDASARGVPTSASPTGSCAVGVFTPLGGGNTQNAPATFTPAPGSYQASVTVSLATVTAGATIHYTTDGSTPDASDTAYSVPLTFVATTTLKAIVIKAGNDPSVVSTGTYTITGGCTY